VLIGARYNGPPGTGNGGYCSGLFAGALGPGHAAVTVTLRLPPSLEVPLVTRAVGQGVEVLDGDRVVASVVPAPEPPAALDPVPAQAARDASTGYPGFVDHPFPTCYVCGPQRNDGLRVFPGPVGEGRSAAIWRVPQDVRPETVWAALDCPGGWTITAPGRRYVLGRMTCAVRSVPAPGNECVVVGQLAGIDGRKAHVHTALYHAAGGPPLATATSIWFAI
jgi:hypothetical protein